jgi:hypothetical protein
MSGSAASNVISRLVTGATGHNTLALPPAVPVFLQRSPGFPGSARGIEHLDFQVLLNGSVIQQGTTGADGRIDVRVPPGGSSTLQLMFNGAAVASYEVSVSPDPLAAANTTTGQMQRLRLLGYQIGHAGPDGNGVDPGAATPPVEFERSVLDFQADNGSFTDANVDANMQGQLTTQAKG